MTCKPKTKHAMWENQIIEKKISWTSDMIWSWFRFRSFQTKRTQCEPEIVCALPVRPAQSVEDDLHFVGEPRWWPFCLDVKRIRKLTRWKPVFFKIFSFFTITPTYWRSIDLLVSRKFDRGGMMLCLSLLVGFTSVEPHAWSVLSVSVSPSIQETAWNVNENSTQLKFHEYILKYLKAHRNSSTACTKLRVFSSSSHQELQLFTLQLFHT